MYRPSKRIVIAGAAVVVVGAALGFVGFSGAASQGGSTTAAALTVAAASCDPPSYDGSTFSVQCAVPQATATVTETPTVLGTATDTATPTDTTAPSATSSPSASSSSTPAPAVAYPDATNTGVPPGTALTAYTGPSTITAADTVINAKTITSCLSIKAVNVRITNSLVRANCGAAYMINAYFSGASLTVTDTELDGLKADGHETGIFGQNFTCTRCKVHNVGEGFNVTDNATITDSYIYDLFGGGSSHNNGIITNGGANLTFTHNNVYAVYSGNYGTSTTGISSAISLFGDFGTVQNVLVQNNLMTSGGGYCTYGGSVPSKPYPHANNVRYVDNQFSVVGNPKCGEFGVVAYFNPAEPGNLWTGNTWYDGPNIGKAA